MLMQNDAGDVDAAAGHNEDVNRDDDDGKKV